MHQIVLPSGIYSHQKKKKKNVHLAYSLINHRKIDPWIFAV